MHKMHTLKVSVKIPVMKRSISGNHPTSNKHLILAISQVLNMYLNDFAKIYGDPELGPISVNKIVFEERDKYEDIKL